MTCRQRTGRTVCRTSDSDRPCSAITWPFPAGDGVMAECHDCRKEPPGGGLDEQESLSCLSPSKPLPG